MSKRSRSQSRERMQTVFSATGATCSTRQELLSSYLQPRRCRTQATTHEESHLGLQALVFAKHLNL